MNKQPMFLPVFLLWSCTLSFHVPAAWAETAASYNAVPLFSTSGAPPLVMLVMGRDHKLYYEAYNDASDLNDDGVLDIRYNPAIDYYGYFDNKKCYTYNSGNSRFEPNALTTNGKKCESAASDWSGDFLNYLTMSRMDTMRKVLYGGYRSTDTAGVGGETVLERVFIPQDAHSWGKEYTSVAVDGYDIADYAPLTVPAAGKRHFLASTTRTSAATPPQFIYVLNQSDRIWNWVAKERPVVNPGRTGEVIREVRVKVCDPAIGLEPNCRQYPDGNYKPTGLLQRHGESLYDTATSSYKTPRMYFGLMTGSYAKSTSGGVLRKKMGNISDEIETNTTGVFKTTVNGIIQTINKLRIYGFSYPPVNYEYNLNCGWITNGPMTEGHCRDWGNPIGEIMYETERYFAGKNTPSTTFDYSGTTDDSNLGLPKATWNNPYDTANGGFDYCAKPFMLVLSDINPSYDSDQLPGVDANFGAGITSDLAGLNVSTSAATISTTEGISGNKFIGQSGALSNGICSEKNVTGLNSIRGLCPEEPTKLGSYYSASVAHYGHTTDLQTTVTGDQKVTTYGIGLASPLPRIEFKVGPDQKLITLVPFGKSVGGYGISSAFYPTNTIVDFFVETLTPTSGRFNINYEDVEQGADHDMDAIITYVYQLVDASNNDVADPLLAAKVKITLTSTYAAGSIIQHLGYIISGTTADGPYLEVRDADTAAGSDVHTSFDTGGTPLPLTATRIFTPSATVGAAAQLLLNPLWYAAKWGGYEEKDSIVGPNDQDEWDKDHDGIPDTYFYVTNPLKLEEQLNKAFEEILRKTKSGTAASVISGSRSGEGAIYQSVFYPEKGDDTAADNKITWAGSVHASFVDEWGQMREDSNQNHILDIKDQVIVFRKLSNGTLVIDRYNLVGAVAEVTTVTLPAAASLASSNYFLLNTVGEPFYVWFIVDGIGTDPLLHGITGISVALLSTDTADNVATKTATAIDAYGDFSVPAPAANTITITNTIPGDVTDATPATSGATIAVTRQGVGETTAFDFSENAENIKYLWNSNTWLNSISDADIVTQRENYDDVAQQRYIFTFIDANQDMIAKANGTEQLEFSATSLPDIGDLDDTATIYPYIPVHSDSETLPAYVNVTGGNRDEFLQKQTQRVINYTRGLDQGSAAITGGTIPAFRSRKLDLDKNGSLEATWRLGDIVNSSPTVVSKPMEALHLLYHDASYGTFAAKYSKRRTVVYAGANDGMLHAFNGGFYEDRFDVFPGNVSPAVPDGITDVSYLLQPKDSTGATISTGFAAYTLGAELWAYIPYNLLPHLYWPTEPDYNHVYFADLKPRIFDAKIFTPEGVCSTNAYDAGCIHPDGWGTVLVGGMRFGGGKINVDMNRMDGAVNSDDRTMTSAYYILDITNPETPPTVLGEISFPHLGYTTCYPTAATMKDKVETTAPAPASPNKWFLIFGSGPAEADGSPGTTSGYSLPNVVSNQKAKLYVVDLVEMAKNHVLKTLDTTGALTEIVPAVPPALPQPGYYQSFDLDNNAFISDPITVDYDLDYKADAVYFGTDSYNAAAVGTEWGGKLRRIVMKNATDPNSWTGNSVLIDLEKSITDPILGSYQPITAAPSVGLDPDGNNWVFFGTGRYFIRNDKDITNQQTFYGIKEPKIAIGSLVNSYVEVLRTDMYDSTSVEVNATTSLVSGGTAPNPTTPWANTPWKDFVNDTKAFAGWYYNFDAPALERNIGQAALFGDLLFFTSYLPAPTDDICEYEGTSYLYALYYLTGTAPSLAAIHDSTNTLTNLLRRKPLGIGMASKPSIHIDKDGEVKIIDQLGDSSLTIEKVNTPGVIESGRTSWGYK